MKNFLIWVFSVILTIFGLILIINISQNSSKVYASSGSTSDLQLMARAINGEARGEPYEGQVAVRSSYS
jgi:N-acetylmuramoyl-L-alanine amidase